MAPPKEPEPALAAPGVGELLSTPSGISGGRSHHKRETRPYSHARLEFDLSAVTPDPGGVLHLEKIAELLKERKIVERGTLILLAAATMHAMASRGLRTIHHWEVSPDSRLRRLAPARMPILRSRWGNCWPLSKVTLGSRWPWLARSRQAFPVLRATARM